MKRIISVLIAALILLSAAGCTSAKTTALIISGTEIDSEIFTYYLDRVIQRPTDYGLAEHPEKKLLKQAVIDECKKYVAINTSFRDKGLSLSSADKVEISQNVNNFWIRFESHYNEIGVSKQTLYKIEESKACEKALLNFYYSDKGVSPVGEDQIKAYFNENYVAVRLVTGYLFNVDENGASVPMTDDQKNNLVNSFSSVATMVNSGSSLEESVSSLGTGTEIRDSLIHAKDSGTLPDGFFSATKAIETGKAAAISLGDYIFLVQRIDVFNEEFGFYSQYCPPICLIHRYT